MGSTFSWLVDVWPLDVLFQTRGYRIRQMAKHNWKPQTFTWPRKTTNPIMPNMTFASQVSWQDGGNRMTIEEIKSDS